MQYLAMVILFGFATISAYAADPQATTEQNKATQQMQSELGAPVPGSVSDQETTIKKRDPSKAQGTEQSSQVTLGGAKSVVMGEVLKVDGDYYFIKDADSGDEVRLLVNNDTRVICTPEQGKQGSTKAAIGKRGEMKDPEASKPQASQGQKKDETAAGAGTRIGSADCQFKSGDKIKAEVSDVGTVTTLRYVSETKAAEPAPTLQAGTGEGAPEMKDKTPSAQALKKSAESATAPADLRGEDAPPAAKQQQQAKADTSTSKECRDCQVVRGRVLKVDGESLVVRDRSKKETRIHIDKTTMIGQRNLKDEPFKEGDRVEAYVTPQGHAHSISLMRAQGGIPGDPDAGG